MIDDDDDNDGNIAVIYPRIAENETSILVVIVDLLTSKIRQYFTASLAQCFKTNQPQYIVPKLAQ